MSLLKINEEIYSQHDSLEHTEKSESEWNFSSESKPIEYFDLFFDSELLSLIVTETNKYAKYLGLLVEPLKLSKIKKWTPVSVLEMAFIAVILKMEITKKPNIPSYWSEHSRNIS